MGSLSLCRSAGQDPGSSVSNPFFRLTAVFADQLVILPLRFSCRELINCGVSAENHCCLACVYKLSEIITKGAKSTAYSTNWGLRISPRHNTGTITCPTWSLAVTDGIYHCEFDEMRKYLTFDTFRPAAVKMRLLPLLSAGILAPTIGLALPASELPVSHDEALYKRENLCDLNAPPALCQPDPTVTVEETAQRAYDFYRAFVVDGDPETMFSLIDSTYKVSYHFDSIPRCTPLQQKKENIVY